MNSKTWTRIIALALFATLAIPIQLAAQGKAKRHHHHQYHHYQLIDMGTLGGPNSYNESNPSENIINASGAATVGADTSVADPFPSNCFIDCFVSDAVVWQGGVATVLDSLDPGYSSFPSAINARGEVVGVSENADSIRLQEAMKKSPSFGKMELSTLGLWVEPRALPTGLMTAAKWRASH